MRTMKKAAAAKTPSSSEPPAAAAGRNNSKERKDHCSSISRSRASDRDGSRHGGGEAVELKKGPWTAEEDELLVKYIKTQGEGGWRTLPKRAGLLRCGKSCRLRWMNYLRPNVKRGHISPDEEDLILRLHRLLGNRWSLIAGRIPGRTDNEIKNYWNTHLSKKLIRQGIDPRTHKPFSDPQNNPNSNKPKNSSTTKDNHNVVAPNANPNSTPTVTATVSLSQGSSSSKGHHPYRTPASQCHVSASSPTVEQINNNNPRKDSIRDGHSKVTDQEEDQYQNFKAAANNLIWSTTTTTTTTTTTAAASTTPAVPTTMGLESSSAMINQLICPNNTANTTTSLQHLLHQHYNDDHEDDIMHDNGDGDDDAFSTFLNSLINDDMMFSCNAIDDATAVIPQKNGNQPRQQLSVIPGAPPTQPGGGEREGEENHAVIMNITASPSLGFQMIGGQWDDPFQS